MADNSSDEYEEENNKEKKKTLQLAPQHGFSENDDDDDDDDSSETDSDEEDDNERHGAPLEGSMVSSRLMVPPAPSETCVALGSRRVLSEPGRWPLTSGGSRPGEERTDLCTDQAFLLTRKTCLDRSREHGQAENRAYDPADYEHLPVSAEVKELFQYINRYTPQLIDLDHKLKPFIPDFIPAVGDIDAFLKVPRPDGKPDSLGLLVLDEPCAKQSDPTVLSLWLTENSKQHNVTQHIRVKSLEDAEKNPKAIDMWIESISELHHSKPPATVHYTRPMPDIDTLMQEWSPDFEELLGKVSLPTAEIDCSLAEYIDMVCAILDIPVYKSRVQALHLLFSLYSEFKNSQHFRALAEGKRGLAPPPSPSPQAGDAETSTLG
ncbi:intraflagellar transport protein 46 homolog isoform 2-T3 [Molossus nigricans]